MSPTFAVSSAPVREDASFVECEEAAKTTVTTDP
jgi:hypothetical protein